MKMLVSTNSNSKSSLEKEIHKISSEVQLKRYGLFLEEHESNLGDLLASMRYGTAPYSEVARNLVKIDLTLKETVTLSQLINVEHTFLSKVIELFTTLCIEIKLLKHEAVHKYYNMLMLYGEDTEEKSQEYIGFSKLDVMLNMLNDLSLFIKRCQLIIAEVIVQMGSLSKSDQLSQFSFAGGVETDIFFYIGDMLLVLITIEEILQNSIVLDHWRMYCRTVKSVHRSHSSFNLDLDTLGNLDDVLTNIQAELLSNNIFQNTLDKCCGYLPMNNEANKLLEKRFNSYIKAMAAELEKMDADLIDSSKSMYWVKLNTLYVFYVKLFNSSDKRFLKNLKDINKKVPCITLIGNVIWCPEQFLSQHSGILKGFDQKMIQEMQRVRQVYLQNKTQCLLRDTHTIALQSTTWVLEITNVLQEGTNNLKLEHLTLRTNLLLQGITYACHLNQIIKSLTNLHMSQNKPMTKSCLLAVCKLIELLKAIHNVFINNSSKIVNFVHNIMQYLIFQSLTIISLTKKSLLSDKSYNKKHPEAMAALILFEKALHGPGTEHRLMIAYLALSNINVSQVFQDENLSKLLKHLKYIERVQNLQNSLECISDCSFLFWHQSILPSYFANVYESKMDIPKIIVSMKTMHNINSVNIIKISYSTKQVIVFLSMFWQYMYQALNDFQDSEKNQENFMKIIDLSLKEKVLEPLCSQVETDLRLQIHSHLQPGLVNPFEDGTPDVSSSLLDLNPILYGQKYIDIKGYVENYLDSMFYNLTTVVLFDWKTYGEMRRLAYEKFSLQTVEDHLPTQTLEQGLDVLEIMRNIHIFVSKYLYNLNNQIFVEKWSNNKHLNTINIQHVANSIRTHGTGIMNTTVNLTYQFLKKKFFVFSQFLYDEHIKSRLLKDLRYFREHRSESNPMYSYDRAYNFNKAIRKLGVSPTGQSYLDHFRLLITHLGNAMGYVRMIRSGGLHSCWNASVFLPTLDENDKFEDLCRECSLSDTVCEAAHVLQQDIKNLASNFAEGSEYFKLLVDVFAPVFRNPRNLHLRNFFIIVPPLTINFVEHLITAKDKLTKKDKSGAAFTDDGFAMGLAYILKLLDQNGEMDSLHWFQSVSEKCSQEKRALQTQKENASKDDKKLQHTLSLTARRLEMFQQEFKLLYYSFSSARIFFQ